jgi:hypothetical protein
MPSRYVVLVDHDFNQDLTRGIVSIRRCTTIVLRPIRSIASFAKLASTLATRPLHSSCVFPLRFDLVNSTLIHEVQEANPEAQIVSFDLLGKTYSGGTLSYIGREFPRRHLYLGGNSTETVPRVAEAYPWLKCDVLSVDGGAFQLVSHRGILRSGI